MIESAFTTRLESFESNGMTTCELKYSNSQNNTTGIKTNTKDLFDGSTKRKNNNNEIKDTKEPLVCNDNLCFTFKVTIDAF